MCIQCAAKAISNTPTTPSLQTTKQNTGYPLRSLKHCQFGHTPLHLQLARIWKTTAEVKLNETGTVEIIQVQ